MKKTIKIGREKIVVKENLWDKAVRLYDPIKGQARFKAKCTSALVGGYSGASKSKRSMSEWSVSGGDADSDILPDLQTLRDRSSDLVRNVPVATSAINTTVTNVIGTGLKLQSRIDRQYLEMPDDEADKLESHIEREFRLWAESKDSDSARSVDFYGQQYLAFMSTLERGDIFYLTPNISRINSPYSLALQSIEADRVINKDWETDTASLGGGVRVDNYGAPIAYHVLKNHPGNMYDPSAEWTVIPAYGSKTGRKNVIHLFDMKRPGQKRGVPYLAPVMEALKQLGRYTDAELMAAVISGMFTVFIESEGSGLDVLSDQTQPNTDDLALGNGLIVDLAPGEKANTTNPGRPNAAFDPFVQSILKQIGSALEIPFELLVKQFNSSYSASKAAFVEAWKFFYGRRAWMTRNFCNPVYELWMDEAVSLGRIEAPGYFADPMIKKAYLGSVWIGPGKGSINEGAEVEAAIKRVDSGLSTLAKESAELDGSDFDTNHRQRVKEQRMREADELVEPVAKPPAPVVMEQPTPPAQEKPEDQDEDDEEEDNKTDKVINRLSLIESDAIKNKIMNNPSQIELVEWLDKFYSNHMTYISAHLGINTKVSSKYTDNAKSSIAYFHEKVDIGGFMDWCDGRYDALLNLRTITPDTIINLPETIVNVAAAEPQPAPEPPNVIIENIVNVPETNVNVENKIEAPIVNIESPTIENIVNVPEAIISIPKTIINVESPVVNTPEVIVNVPESIVNITNEIARSDAKVTFKRDSKGNIVSAEIDD